MTNVPRPVFVVGMNGSGTTMLADSLGKHPDLYMLRPEAKVLPYFMRNLHRYGDLAQMSARRRLANDIGRTMPFWQVNNHSPLVVEDSRLTEPSFCGVVDAIFSELAQRQGKCRWGEKSPMNIGHIAELGKHFERAKFIHIIRDGRDAAQSFHRRYGYEPRHTIFRWKMLVNEGRRQGAGLGRDRYFEVFYEDLTQQPGMQMKRVCEFLGLEYTSSVLESSMLMIDPVVAGDNKTIIENSGKWQDYFCKQDIEDLEKIAGASLEALGYPVSNNSGDDDVSLLKRRWWWVRDRFTATRRYFKRWGVRALPTYLRFISAALMQSRVNKL